MQLSADQVALVS